MLAKNEMMKSATDRQPSSMWMRIIHSIRRQCLAGLFVAAPLWLTYVALKFFFHLLDSVFAPLLRHWVGVSIPGLGFILLFLFLYLIGMMTSNILGRSFFHFWEAMLHRIPLVKNVYQGAKQLVHTFSIPKAQGFERVVLVEYPRAGLFAVGFVTNATEDQRTARTFAVVFIPTTPNPTSGVLELVPRAELIETNLTVEEGIIESCINNGTL
ncbi:MAG: DUF502 domain-containing protein [Nitrospirae bacterium]|nr:DUF502 domain-containing protein [Nitrospirota bacterium]